MLLRPTRSMVWWVLDEGRRKKDGAEEEGWVKYLRARAQANKWPAGAFVGKLVIQMLGKEGKSHCMIA